MISGVDFRADTVHVAVISDNGGHLADADSATTAAGYAAALAFLNGHVVAIQYGRMKGTDRPDALARLRPAGDAVPSAKLSADKVTTLAALGLDWAGQNAGQPQA